MSLIPDDAQAPGYCSVATAPLTSEQISRIVAALSSGKDSPGITRVVSEKDLGLKGNRQLVELQHNGKVILVEYAGVRKAKFVSKDRVRFNDMVGKALGDSDKDPEDFVKVVLLKEDGTICRRNTLKALHEDGVVVMRCPRAGAGDDSDSDESDE